MIQAIGAYTLRGPVDGEAASRPATPPPIGQFLQKNVRPSIRNYSILHAWLKYLAGFGAFVASFVHRHLRVEHVFAVAGAKRPVDGVRVCSSSFFSVSRRAALKNDDDGRSSCAQLPHRGSEFPHFSSFPYDFFHGFWNRDAAVHRPCRLYITATLNPKAERSELILMTDGAGLVCLPNRNQSYDQEKNSRVQGGSRWARCISSRGGAHFVGGGGADYLHSSDRRDTQSLPR